MARPAIVFPGIGSFVQIAIVRRVAHWYSPQRHRGPQRGTETIYLPTGLRLPLCPNPRFLRGTQIFQTSRGGRTQRTNCAGIHHRGTEEDGYFFKERKATIFQECLRPPLCLCITNSRFLRGTQRFQTSRAATLSARIAWRFTTEAQRGTEEDGDIFAENRADVPSRMSPSPSVPLCASVVNANVSRSADCRLSRRPKMERIELVAALPRCASVVIL